MVSDTRLRHLGRTEAGAWEFGRPTGMCQLPRRHVSDSQWQVTLYRGPRTRLTQLGSNSTRGLITVSDVQGNTDDLGDISKFRMRVESPPWRFNGMNVRT